MQNVTVNEDDGSQSNSVHVATYFACNRRVDAITVDRYTRKHLKIGDLDNLCQLKQPIQRQFCAAKNERLDHGSISQRGYFEGRNRISACFVQGKFKQNIAVKDVLTGQSFGTNLVNLPSKFLIQMLFGVLNRISPNMVADVACQKPYLLTPLIAAAQT